jgi:fibronectin type 3 domain-containing protein
MKTLLCLTILLLIFSCSNTGNQSINPVTADVEISGRKQIASTISNAYTDISVHNMPQYYYKVVAVDQSGNASK